MRPSLRTLLGLVAACCVSAASANACSCEESTVEELYGYADAVFSGEVTAVEVTDQECEERGVAMTVEVMDCWKGDLDDVEIVYTVFDEACCGIPLSPGEYLFFAYEYSSGEWAGDLYTNLCSGTRSLAGADAELEYLGEPGCVPSPTVPSSWSSVKNVYR